MRRRSLGGEAVLCVNQLLHGKVRIRIEISPVTFTKWLVPREGKMETSTFKEIRK